MASALDLCFSKARLVENPPRCLSSGFAKQGCWRKGGAKGSPRLCVAHRLTLPSCLRQRNRAALPSDPGTLRGSPFHGNPFSFVGISDPNHLLFGPNPWSHPFFSHFPYFVASTLHTQNPPRCYLLGSGHHLLSPGLLPKPLSVSLLPLSATLLLPTPTACSPHGCQRVLFKTSRIAF